MVQRKAGGLRNGAPFEEMPEPLEQLQAILLRRLGGDAVMAQVLAAAPIHGLEHVLVAVELARGWPLQLREEPLANVDRYDDLRGQRTTEHSSDQLSKVMP